jgi:predicted acetyltransferase
MDNITYHRANQAELQTIVDFRIEFLIEFWGNQSSDAINELKEFLKIYFKESLINNTSICYIAKSGNENVGIGCLAIREQPGNFKNPSGKVGYLSNMYTRPSHRRKGICTGILNLLIDAAKDAGITAFELLSTKEGEYVYKKNGFELHNQPTYKKYIN